MPRCTEADLIYGLKSNSRYSEPTRAIHVKEAKNGTSYSLSSDAL